MVIGRLEPFGAKIAQYFPHQRFLDFGMPQYGFDDAGTGVYPQRALGALPFQVAAGMRSRFSKSIRFTRRSDDQGLSDAVLR